jgi:hypothetical protein
MKKQNTVSHLAYSLNKNLKSMKTNQHSTIKKVQKTKIFWKKKHRIEVKKKIKLLKYKKKNTYNSEFRESERKQQITTLNLLS